MLLIRSNKPEHSGGGRRSSERLRIIDFNKSRDGGIAEEIGKEKTK